MNESFNISNTRPYCYFCLSMHNKETKLYICSCSVSTCKKCIVLHQNIEKEKNNKLNNKKVKSKKIDHKIILRVEDSEIKPEDTEMKEEKIFDLNKKLLSCWYNTQECTHIKYSDLESDLENIDKKKVENFYALKNTEKNFSLKEVLNKKVNEYDCASCIEKGTEQIHEKGQIKNLYICLICFKIECGRDSYQFYGFEHMKAHNNETKHNIAINLFNGLCFCYECSVVVVIPKISEYFEKLNIYQMYVKELETNNSKETNNFIDINKEKDLNNNIKEEDIEKDIENNIKESSKENSYKKIPAFKQKEFQFSKISFNLKYLYEDLNLLENKNLFVEVPNFRNTCYVATSLQLLSRIFKNKKLNFEKHFYECTNEIPYDCLSCWLLKIFKYLNPENQKSKKNLKSTKNSNLFFITDFLTQIFVKTSQFTDMRHEDGSEFLNYIFGILENIEGKEGVPILTDYFKIRYLKISACIDSLEYFSNKSISNEKIDKKNVNKKCLDDINISTDYAFTHIIDFNTEINKSLKSSIQPIELKCEGCEGKKIFKDYLIPSNDLLLDLKRYKYNFEIGFVEKIDEKIEINEILCESAYKYEMEEDEKEIKIDLRKVKDFYEKEERFEKNRIFESILKDLNDEGEFKESYLPNGTVLHSGTADSGHYMLMLLKDFDNKLIEHNISKKGYILSDDRIYECPAETIENGYIFWYSIKK